MATYRVTGLEQVLNKLRAFPREFQTQALVPALLKGAAPIAAQAEILAPKETGAMAAAITILVDKKPQLSGYTARVIVYVRYKGKNGRKYWRFVEFGTSFQAPQPFMRPAFESQKMQAVAIILGDLAAAVPRIANRLGV